MGVWLGIWNRVVWYTFVTGCFFYSIFFVLVLSHYSVIIFKKLVTLYSYKFYFNSDLVSVHVQIINYKVLYLSYFYTWVKRFFSRYRRPRLRGINSKIFCSTFRYSIFCQSNLWLFKVLTWILFSIFQYLFVYHSMIWRLYFSCLNYTRTHLHYFCMYLGSRLDGYLIEYILTNKNMNFNSIFYFV